MEEGWLGILLWHESLGVKPRVTCARSVHRSRMLPCVAKTEISTMLQRFVMCAHQALSSERRCGNGEGIYQVLS